MKNREVYTEIGVVFIENIRFYGIFIRKDAEAVDNGLVLSPKSSSGILKSYLDHLMNIELIVLCYLIIFFVSVKRLPQQYSCIY